MRKESIFPASRVKELLETVHSSLKLDHLGKKKALKEMVEQLVV